MSNTIIKAGEHKPLAKGACRLDLRDISAMAETALAAARSEADRIVARAGEQAAAERETAREVARREGYEAGFEAGQQAGREEALEASRQTFATEQASLVTALTSLVADFTAKRERMLLAARRDVVVLAIAIARRLSQHLAGMEDVAPEMAVEACEQTLSLIRNQTDVVVRVHPQDAAAMRRFLDGNAGRSGEGATAPANAARAMAASDHFRIVEDEKTGRGGVLVETADGQVDATVSGRVDRVADELMAAWRLRWKELGL
ncbi:MAG: FliH/SctL family protein [Phycisphaerae bacterium]